jgi:GntR family transcriptional regulator
MARKPVARTPRKSDAKSGSEARNQRQPRYMAVADALRASILRGDFAESLDFPTELELCTRFGVSRFTVREALRALEADRLISRRRGSGTTVKPPSARAGALHQPLSNVREILQYARDTEVTFEAGPSCALPGWVREAVSGAPTEGWASFRGIRRPNDGGAPIAVVDAYIHPELAHLAGRIDPAQDTIFRQLEQLGGFQIALVEQDIEAVAAGLTVVKALGITRRSPCLRILRCYRDASGRIVEFSVSHHPGDRFAYALRIDVDA